MTHNSELLLSRRTLIIWFAIGVALWATEIDAQGPVTPAIPEVETVGTAERRVAPDRATVIIQIESKAGAANAAASLNARALQRVRDTLKTMGLESATTTSSYTVGPNYDRGAEGPVRDGYVARTILRVQLGKLADVGRVIDAGLAAGATGVGGVMYESSVATDARRSALADAAAAARADAEVLARAMGGTLGALIGTSTAAGNDPRRANVLMRSEMSLGGIGSGNTQITPNEIVITAGVVARWRFIPTR